MFLLLKDLEIENEDLRERLRKIQQEQRILLDKVNGLQLQLNEVNSLNLREKTQSCFISCSNHPVTLCLGPVSSSQGADGGEVHWWYLLGVVILSGSNPSLQTFIVIHME